jgi:tetratricopeptide (TPR) repeat protein
MRVIFSLFFCINICYAQTSKIDSLKNELKKNPTNVEIISLIGLAFSKSNKDTFIYYANYANSLAKTDCEKSFAYNALGGVAVLNSKLDSSIYFYNVANIAAQKCDNKMQTAQVLINWAFVNILKGNNDSTLILTANAIEKLNKIAETPNSIVLYCKALKYKGDAYSRLGQFDKATEVFFEAKKKNNNSDKIVGALIDGSLGSLYTNKLEFNKAIKYFKSSAESFEKMGDIVNSQLQFSNLANAFIENKNYDSAAIFLKKCEPLLLKIKSPVKVAYVNKSWARLYLAVL